MVNGKGNVHKYTGNNSYEVIPRQLLQSCDSHKLVKDNVTGKYTRVKKDESDRILSLQAIGLLCNLQSYPDDWEINKTELYKRYGKHRKTAVSSAWDELVDAGYIIQFRKRIGRKYEYTYYFSVVPFEKEDIEKIEHEENARSRDNLGFRFSEAQNGKPKMGSPKPATSIIHNKSITHKPNTHKEKTQPSPVGSGQFDDEELINKYSSEVIILKKMNYTHYAIMDILTIMANHEISHFSEAQIKAEHLRMKKYVEKNHEEITAIGKFFVEGILKHEDSRKILKELAAAKREQAATKHEEPAQKPSYNGLDI